MRLPNAKRLLIAGAICACTLLTAATVWRSTAFNEPQKVSRQEAERLLGIDVRDGLGRETHFAKKEDADKKDFADKVKHSVELTADFIRARSGLELSDDTKKRLTRMEEETLKGKRRPITVDELTDVLTETAVERIASASDEELKHAEDTFSKVNGFPMLRANGQGMMERSDFAAEARSAREKSRSGDMVFKNMARFAVSAQVEDRVRVFSGAVPDKFGDVAEKGLTPSQAILVTYSVAGDDLLTDSRESLKNKVEGVHKALKERGANVPAPDKAYGKDGFFFASPLDIFLDEPTTTTLLDRIEKSGVK